MALQVSCPNCDLVVERPESESLPSHCPACGNRLSCPRCGSALTRRSSATQHIRCTHCQLDLDGQETAALKSAPARTQVDLSFAIPGFELRAKLGEGGMGIVYRAWQQRLNREVAIKVLPPALAANPALLDRFRNEAEIAGRLTDSHLLQVFDVLEVQGVPIIVMPLIEGCDLGAILRQRRAAKQSRPPAPVHPWATLDDQGYVDRLLPVLDQLVAAVAALHQANIIHRDIKPSNVLVDQRGNLWLSDFGLARLEHQSFGTQPGLIGTRGFASPEQARGDRDIDLRTDLFSLGATLYQALTLELPYGKQGAQAQSAPPMAPSRRQPLLPRDLDTVVLKALEVDRRQRYRSAAAFQEDWTRVRKGLVPLERRPGPLRRLLRTAKRRPAGAIAAAAIAALLLVLGATLFPRGARVNRTVYLATEPPGARVVLVPLHQDNGFPLPEQALRPAGTTPLTVRDVAPGEYLVVADVPGHGFHEVYRTVPTFEAEGSKLLRYKNADWKIASGDVIQLPVIAIPSGDVTQGMALFKGGRFTMGSADVPWVPPHSREVPAFYLDTTEVSIGTWKNQLKALPTRLEDKPLPDSRAMCWVSYGAALEYAEAVGKRIPDEAEYEFAATDGGKRRFPWGNDRAKLTSWPFGDVGTPRFDHTDTEPPVYGLYSNVAEWTTSWMAPYPGTDPKTVEGFYRPDIRDAFRLARVVRGGPPEVVQGAPDLADPAHTPLWDARFRHGFTVDQTQPGLGFRCARSAQPRFLER
jgi:formylglycine-generating enzyme required for sulfatase activity